MTYPGHTAEKELEVMFPYPDPTTPLSTALCLTMTWDMLLKIKRL